MKSFQTLLYWIHILQAAFALIVLGLTANGIDSLDNQVPIYENPFPDSGILYTQLPTVKFLLFASIWSICVLGYVLTYMLGPPSFLPYVHYNLESALLQSVTCIFWFSGFIAQAVFLGKLSFCSGYVCQEQIVTVFAALSFVLWAFTAGVAVISSVRELTNFRR